MIGLIEKDNVKNTEKTASKLLRPVSKSLVLS
jgi:hypothetical protein